MKTVKNTVEKLVGSLLTTLMAKGVSGKERRDIADWLIERRSEITLIVASVITEDLHAAKEGASSAQLRAVGRYTKSMDPETIRRAKEDGFRTDALSIGKYVYSIHGDDEERWLEILKAAGGREEERPLDDSERRDLGASWVWAMDVEVDAGKIPADIEPLLHRDRWNNLTLAESRRILRWFYSTAPGDFS